MNGLYFIAGGTGVIGSGVARRLRAQGAGVLLAARNEARLEECARELGARAVPMDATRPEAVTSAFDTASGGPNVPENVLAQWPLARALPHAKITSPQLN